MDSSDLDPAHRVKGVRFSADQLIVDLEDGRTISAPLDWYPRLLNASTAERANWETYSAGWGIH